MITGAACLLLLWPVPRWLRAVSWWERSGEFRDAKST